MEMAMEMDQTPPLDRVSDFSAFCFLWIFHFSIIFQIALTTLTLISIWPITWVNGFKSSSASTITNGFACDSMGKL